MIEVPYSKWDETHKRIAFIDPNEIAGIEAYESDYTITVLFKGGTRMKYGPFSENDFEEFVNAIVN